MLKGKVIIEEEGQDLKEVKRETEGLVLCTDGSS
jgi:hypothetical protein